MTQSRPLSPTTGSRSSDAEVRPLRPQLGRVADQVSVPRTYCPIPLHQPSALPSSYQSGQALGTPCTQTPLGTWKYGLVGDESKREGFVTVEVAEVCEAEFVPEPGSIALLGSGLAGLAGYAILRLRSGKARR